MPCERIHYGISWGVGTFTWAVHTGCGGTGLDISHVRSLPSQIEDFVRASKNTWTFTYVTVSRIC